MKHYKTPQRQRERALARYYAKREECLAAQEKWRREQGIPPRRPAMTEAEKLAAVVVCRECDGRVTSPSLLKSRRHMCTKCIKRRDRERERQQGVGGRERRRWRASPTGKMQKFKTWKAKQKCSKCGYDKDPQKLHFHHRDPAAKVMKVSRMLHAFGMKAVWEEVAKCDLLCETCHEAVHAGPLY